MNNLYLAHHGILGMKWGVRRWQNEDGSLTPRGRKRLQKYKNKFGSTENEKIKQDKNVDKLSRSGIIIGDNKDIIKEGATINRIANAGEPIDAKRKYVSITADDKDQYRSTWDALGAHLDKPMATYEYKAVKDISVASYETVVNHIMDNYASVQIQNIKNVLDEFGGIINSSRKEPSLEKFFMVKMRYDFNKSFRNILKTNLDSISSDLAKQGYDAMLDVEDARGFAEYPVILINPQNSIKLMKEERFAGW